MKDPHEPCRKKALEAWKKGYEQGRLETYQQVMREAEKMLLAKLPEGAPIQ